MTISAASERRALFSIFRVLFVALGTLASLTALAQADNNNTNTDQSAAIGALAAAHSGDWAQAYARAGVLQDSLALKMVRWLDYIRSNAGYRSNDIAGFVDQNPGWPLQKKLLRRVEESLGVQPDDVAADWLK